jgi:hypothetical protein
MGIESWFYSRRRTSECPSATREEYSHGWIPVVPPVIGLNLRRSLVRNLPACASASCRFTLFVNPMTALPLLVLALIAVRQLLLALPVVALAWIAVLREWRAYRDELGPRTNAATDRT